jgi:nitrate reductase assembly molybdenum cofactor insertion protein NarJ
MKLNHYALLAGLYQYPDAGYPQKVKDIQNFVDSNYPEACEDMDTFAELLPAHDLNKMEELYIRSFDVQSVTTLDIGYVLFGDDYKRGELLANLNREHTQTDNDCGSELGDHLPNLLRLISKLDDQDLIGEMIEELIVPALTKMISEFEPGRMEKKNELYKKHYKTLIETPEDGSLMYLSCLKVLDKVIRKDFSIVDKPEKRQTIDFLQSLDTEIEIENEVKT